MTARPRYCLAFLVQTSSRHLIQTPTGMTLPADSMVSIPEPSNSMTALNMLDPNDQFFPVHRHANRYCAPYRSGPSKTWIKVKNPKAPAATRAIDGTFYEVFHRFFVPESGGARTKIL